MRLFISVMTALLFSVSGLSLANEEDDLAAMQKQMNSDIMKKPFLAEEPEKVNAYIAESLKKKLPAPEYTGIHWRQGYTCRDLLRWSWREYRNCRYYHRRHGRYYHY